MAPTREATVRPKASFSFTVALMGILLVGSLAVLVLAGLTLARSRVQHLGRAEINAQNLCLVLGENLTGFYEKSDLQLLALADEVERQLASGALDASCLDAYIERSRLQIPILDGFRRISAQGKIHHGTDVKPGYPIDVSDREYFRRLRDEADPGLVISKPILSRITGRWEIILARRVRGRDGVFGGAVTGAITLEGLTRLFTSLNLGQEGSISLRDSDLAIIVRQTRLAKPSLPLGESFAFPELQAQLKSGRSQGSFTTASPVDHIERIYAYRQIRGGTQLLMVGLGKQEALADWNREVHQTLAFAALFLLLILTCSWLVHRSWRKQAEVAAKLLAEEAEFRCIFEHSREGIFQVELDGTILSLNPAFARMWGYASPEEMALEVRSFEYLDCVRPEDRDRLKRMLRESGQFVDLEMPCRRKDGGLFWVLANAHLFPGSEGGSACCEGMILDITERKRAEEEREGLILALQNAMADVKALSGLLPICSSCKKIRDDQGYWNHLETYISSHSDANFTHGICPDCAREFFPEAFARKDTTSE